MASQPKTPPEPESQGDAPAEIADTAPPASFVGEYVDDTPRTYQFPGSGPQTAERGDVCELPHDPADGRWKPSTRKLTRLRDNHPDQAAITSAKQAAARAEIHRLAAEQDAAASGKA